MVILHDMGNMLILFTAFELCAHAYKHAIDDMPWNVKVLYDMLMTAHAILVSVYDRGGDLRKPIVQYWTCSV